MPYFVAFLATVIVPLIPSIVRGLVTYVAVSLGFGLVAYTGISAAIDELAAYIQANFDGIGADLANILALGGLDVCVNVTLTCLVFGFTLKGLMNATGYKAKWKAPSNPNNLL